MEKLIMEKGQEILDLNQENNSLKKAVQTQIQKYNEDTLTFKNNYKQKFLKRITFFRIKFSLKSVV